MIYLSKKSSIGRCTCIKHNKGNWSR